jgi:S-adenosylmethionine:tRNA ribosyltransferase-isomerase
LGVGKWGIGRSGDLVIGGLSGPARAGFYNVSVLVSEFDYHLPEELIAQQPLADRAASRMLHLVRETGVLEDRWFRELPDLLRPDDLVVFNNTRVFPARLYGHRSGARSQPVSKSNPAAKEFLKGRVEVLLTGPAEEESSCRSTRMNADEGKLEISADLRTSAANPLFWKALVRPGRKIGVGEKLFFGENRELRAEVIARAEFGERTLRFEPVEDFFAVVERIGHVPLPPYIARPDAAADRERYQTVYARTRGSVAAPTAGLHFTPEILERMRARGMETAEITLHVGLGTFQPVHAEKVEEHKLHREWYRISEEAAAQINGALAAGRRVVAVGTTTVRTLEYAALGGVPSPESRVPSKPVEIAAGTGEVDLFIYPGFQCRVVGAMLTNFHLPKSTLLMLVSAFAGREFVLNAYRHAVEERYRFYSYGDCMLVD